MACSCVKSGALCTDCLPARKGQCSNLPPLVSSAHEESHGTELSLNDSQSSPLLLSNRTSDAGAADNVVTNDDIPSCSPPEQLDSTVATTVLPSFSPASSTAFHWGNVLGDIFCRDITLAYEEQVKWRKNTFSPPTGHAGTEFVKEHARLLRAYTNKTPLERVSLWAIMVMPSLLLQKPHAKAGSKEFSQHLSRRLVLWKEGKILELLDEARTIQSRLPQLDSKDGMSSSKLNRRFAALVSKGNIHAAISLRTMLVVCLHLLLRCVTL